MAIVTDLEKVDPKGRVDVLVYRGLKFVAQQVEQKHNIKGIWDALKPTVNNAVVSAVSDIPIPSEMQAILSIIQANMM